MASLLLAAGVAWGDFDAGDRAYKAKEYTTALQEYREAAEKGHVKAQGKLASMYLYGVGTRTDYQQAYIWFDLAARQGDKYAARFRDAAAGAMTREQFEEADAMTDEYYERYVAPFAAPAEQTSPRP